MYSEIRYLPCGEAAISIEFGDEISKEIHLRIKKMETIIEQKALQGLGELIPTYRSLLVHYDPQVWTFDALVKKLQSLSVDTDGSDTDEVVRIEIPTLYGGEYGPDIGFVSEHTGLSIDEIITRHTAYDCLVYMLGFMPGFTYLGGMDAALETPRLKTPRLEIPPGSVGIAGKQTGMYPLLSPGGWRLIGRTPVPLFNPQKNPPVFIEPGNYIRYRAISLEEYEQIQWDVAKGSYQVKMERIKQEDLCLAE